jgi:hypothetical protein
MLLQVVGKSQYSMFMRSIRIEFTFFWSSLSCSKYLLKSAVVPFGFIFNQSHPQMFMAVCAGPSWYFFTNVTLAFDVASGGGVTTSWGGINSVSIYAHSLGLRYSQ